jgi:hypothetical protein
MIRRFLPPACALGVAVAFALSTPTQGQERTVEGAQRFLTDVSTRGATTANWLPNGLAERKAVITASGSSCLTTIGLSDGRSVRINWSKVSEIRWIKYPSLSDSVEIFSGDFPSWSGGTQTLMLTYDSEATADRIVAAGQFLKQQCDRLTDTGF